MNPTTLGQEAIIEFDMQLTPVPCRIAFEGGDNSTRQIRFGTKQRVPTNDLLGWARPFPWCPRDIRAIGKHPGQTCFIRCDLVKPDHGNLQG